MPPGSIRPEAALSNLPAMPNLHASPLVVAGSTCLLVAGMMGAITGCRSPQASKSATVAYSKSLPTEVIENAVPLRAQPLPLSDVRLTGGPLQHAQELMAKYLLELNPDQIMYYLREDAGLKPKADRGDVIGVVSDMKNQGLLQDAAPEAFIPYSVAGYGQDVIFVHTVGDPAALSRSLTTEILRLDRSVIPQQTMTMDAILDIGQYAQPRFGLGLFSVFAGIGLVLVTTGVYSVVSWTVTQQRHEIGIRMALGASAGDVRSMVLTGTLQFVLMGVAAGIVLVWVVGRVLASQLWGVSGYDPLTLCGVISVLIAVGLVAAYVPSVRATRVDPAACLRGE